MFSFNQHKNHNSRQKTNPAVYKGTWQLPTSVRVHSEPAVFVPTDNVIGNLPAGLGVAAGCMHSKQRLPHCRVLRHVGGVLALLEHRRVVVDVQDRDHKRADGGQTRWAQVAGGGPQLVRRLHLTVQSPLQTDDARVLVDGEEAICRVRQRVDDAAVDP